MNQFKAVEYLALAQKAAARLHWLTVAATADTITWHTPGTEYSRGVAITLIADRKTASLQCKPIHEYYWEEGLNKQKIELFIRTLDKVIAEYIKADRNLHPMHREKYGALVPSKSYLITPIIVYINVAIFLVMVLTGISPLHPTSQSLLMWGGNFRPAVSVGEWWRLITYMFLHGGIMHLAMNTYALLYIGMFLEPLMGKFRFASTYLITGVCAGLMSITMHPASVCIGASGAIFGMYGVFFSILTTRHIEKTLRKTMLRSILFFIVFNLMMGLQGNTDNAAHIGGLVSGIVIGFVHYRGISRHAPIGNQLLTAVLLLAGVALLTYLFVHVFLH